MFKWFWTLFSLGALAPETVPNARHHRKRRKLKRKLGVSKFENADYLQYTEQCRLVNEMVKTAKETYFATIIEISKGDQRSLFQSIDHLLNRKAVPRFPLSSSDLELAESFKNFLANKIEPIRAHVIAVTTPPSLKICCDDNPHEFTNFRPVSSKKISDLIGFKVESCEVYPVLRLYWNLLCLC